MTISDIQRKVLKRKRFLERIVRKGKSSAKYLERLQKLEDDWNALRKDMLDEFHDDTLTAGVLPRLPHEFELIKTGLQHSAWVGEFADQTLSEKPQS